MRKEEALGDLLNELFEAYVKLNPIVATYLGIHRYDHLMPNVSREQTLEKMRLLESFLEKLRIIDQSKLRDEGKLDYVVADMFLQFNIFWLKDLGFWERNPDYVTLVGDAIYPLFSRRFAPVEERAKSIAARLVGTDVMLEQSKTCIRKPVKLWTEIAVETCERTSTFVKTVVGSIAPTVDMKVSAELREAAEEATESIEKYEVWLKNDILPRTTENFTVKMSTYDKLIQIRRLDLSTKEILSLGQKYLKEGKKQLEEIAREIKAGATVKEVKELIKGRHPRTFEEALKRYEESMQKAKKFIIKRGIATMPTAERLEIVETPMYLRHLVPFAAYDSPAPFDEDQAGRYMVTPIEDKPELIKEHNYASIVNTTVHEGYPGHHLQLVCSNRNPSRIRHLTSQVGYIGTETIEGYAHWAEDFMRRIGYEDTPEMRFIRISDMMWRAARIIIDVKLCKGQMTFEEAVETLVREAGMERPSAIAEVKRYTLNPTYQLSYLIGKHLIQQLRDEVRRKMGKAYSDIFFIDTIIYSGSAPYAVLREIFDQKLKSKR